VRRRGQALLRREPSNFSSAPAYSLRCPGVARLNFLTEAPPLRHPLRRVSRSDRPPRARPWRARIPRRTGRTVRRPWEVPGGGRARARRAQDAVVADGARRRSVPASCDRLARCSRRRTDRERSGDGRCKCQCLRSPTAHSAASGRSPAAAPTPSSERACRVRRRARSAPGDTALSAQPETGQSREALNGLTPASRTALGSRGGTARTLPTRGAGRFLLLRRRLRGSA
jgi:hypothetical protein